MDAIVYFDHPIAQEASMSQLDPLPQLRFDISEVSRVLRISRATLYQRIRERRITTQKDGRRTFITASELQRYVNESR
jgi:excisionase family DNA binding protein